MKGQEAVREPRNDFLCFLLRNITAEPDGYYEEGGCDLLLPFELLRPDHVLSIWSSSPPMPRGRLVEEAFLRDLLPVD